MSFEALWTDWGSPGDKGPEDGLEIAERVLLLLFAQWAIVGGESGGRCGAELEMKGTRVGRQVSIRRWEGFDLWS